MNWFQRHLHLTWVLGCPLTLIVLLYISRYLKDVPIFASDTVGVIAVVIMFGTSGWVIHRKGRSLWWLLSGNPFAPLLLENRKWDY